MFLRQFRFIYLELNSVPHFYSINLFLDVLLLELFASQQVNPNYIDKHDVHSLEVDISC